MRGKEPHTLAVLAMTLGIGCGGSGTSAAETKKEPSPAFAPAQDPPPPGKGLASFNFDEAKAGALPPGVTATETNGKGAPAAWGVVKADGAPSGGNAFGVTATTNTGQTYNVALFDGPPLGDLELSVMIKPVSGEEDQGGGVVFRAQGPGDYYICRWNPLEKNVKFYKVVGSNRDALAKADIDIDVAKWQAMRVVVEGPRMELFMNEESVLTVSDTSITKPGGAGLWTKADAATLFDDFTVSKL